MSALNKITELKEHLIKCKVKSFTKLGKSIHKLVLISDQRFEWHFVAGQPKVRFAHGCRLWRRYAMREGIHEFRTSKKVS